MIRTTIKDAWLRKIDATAHPLYLFRDEDTVFYVGHSSSPLERLRHHLSAFVTDGGSGKLGKLLREHLPESLEWTMELFMVDDCDSLVKQLLPEQYEKFQQGNPEERSWTARDIAEQALILFYHPHLNTQHNPDRSPLPEKYLNATQAAAKLGVHEKTVRRWIDEGRLEAIHVTKNRYAISPEEVERIAEGRRQHAVTREDEHLPSPDQVSHLADESQIDSPSADIYQLLVDHIDTLSEHLGTIVQASTGTPSEKILQKLEQRIAGLEAQFQLRTTALETYLQQLTKTMEALVSQRETQDTAQPHGYYLDDAKKTTGRTKQPENTLPEGLVPWRAFANLHTVPQNVIRDAWKAGFVHIVRGKWNVAGQSITEALDAKGQRDFWVQFHILDSFRPCDTCPHEEWTKRSGTRPT